MPSYHRVPTGASPANMITKLASALDQKANAEERCRSLTNQLAECLREHRAKRRVTYAALAQTLGVQPYLVTGWLFHGSGLTPAVAQKVWDAIQQTPPRP